MPKIFTADGYDFHVDIDFAPDIETSLRVGVKVHRLPLQWRRDQKEEEKTFSAYARVEGRDREQPYLVVEVDGREVFAEPLDEVLGGDEVVNAIPAEVFGGGERIVGCLVRAGLSAIVDQIKKCWASIRAFEGFFDRVKRAAECVQKNALGLSMKASFRAGACIAGPFF